MRQLRKRVDKLEPMFKPEETIVIHRVIWDGDNPTGYLLDGKVYPNDDTLEDAIHRDYPPLQGKVIRVLWEPVYE